MNNPQRPPVGTWAPLRMQWDAHPVLTIAIAITSVAEGAIAVAVIDTINGALHDAEQRSVLLPIFVGLIVASLLLSAIGSILPAYVSRRILTFLRLEMCRKILSAPLREIEQRGLANMLTMVADDLPTLSRTLLLLPNVFANSVTLLCVLAYIGFLSWIALAMMFAVALVGVGGYSLLHGGLVSLYRRRREEHEVFNERAQGLVFGVKELKLHEGRRRWFRKAGFGLSARRVAAYDFDSSVWDLGIETWSSVGYFCLIGIMVFWVHSFEIIAPAVLTACVLAAMYAWGPYRSLFAMVPELGEGKVACERLADFDIALSIAPYPPSPFRKKNVKTAWRSIELRGVTLDYAADDQPVSGFRLGPVDLRFQPREIVFIAGGNGSGKSSLGKILTGLYVPNAGTVLLDGAPVEDVDRGVYRSLFSAVFQDSYTFNRIVGPKRTRPLESRVQEYLDLFALSAKVRAANTQFSTTQALSQGERKRLSLLCAYLEDRPIYVLDEPAAEQDPAFKKFFYEEMIRDLRERGKCVVVITHDDRYFHVADRVIQLEDGRVVAATGTHVVGAGVRKEVAMATRADEAEP